MANCLFCKKFEKCLYRIDREFSCRDYQMKPITNADRIRSMSDEELAEMFLTHDEQLYRHCPSDTFAEYCQVKPCVECCDCKACWIDWLRHEAKEGE